MISTSPTGDAVACRMLIVPCLYVLQDPLMTHPPAVNLSQTVQQVESICHAGHAAAWWESGDKHLKLSYVGSRVMWSCPTGYCWNISSAFLAPTSVWHYIRTYVHTSDDMS